MARSCIFRDRFVRAFTALGKSTDTHGDMLTCPLLAKVPIAIRRSLAQQRNTHEWILDQLRGVLKEELRVLMATMLTQPKPSRHSTKTPQQNITAVCLVCLVWAES